MAHQSIILPAEVKPPDAGVNAKPTAAELLKAATDYHRRGWSIVPILAGTKQPPPGVTWHQFQQKAASLATVYRWFARDDIGGIGILAGAVSGGLVVRDFDGDGAYARWQQDHPDLAAQLPTIQTGRGHHVYFHGDAAEIVHLADGELRGAGYTLAPPSLHPSGKRYAWILPPSDELPEVDPEAAGFLICAETPRLRDSETPNDSEGNEHETEYGFTRLFLQTIPNHVSQRNQRIFALCRLLKAEPRFATAHDGILLPVVREWHRLASPFISTKGFEDTWTDFLYGWARVKYPAGQGQLQTIVASIPPLVTDDRLPPAAKAYESPELRRLVILCRELQAAAGDEPFFLSGRTATQLLGLDQAERGRVGRWLATLLVHDGILSITTQGTEHKATRYRYVAQDGGAE